ncbi:MAG: DNA repair protein RecO [Candidatus Nealsonbacteria bacterium CG10_big_fil_rev_8_21_14_0_10_36_24]|uniref:DNA repair protein RecO n=2 Tax=Candidatus Nealsoniibacteriota TaxID=1817911 RepID=A0A2H0YP38_9BACT|nr:MAG: DNA repair protein RecO [Candidatus Nealsonbacteria bacterium CG10_big_fil_rev_8_21_14_0_10_36_24]PIS40261.1 MAG: DNA repair protein RecO [Candidatus Nealsonbacteria bacterium CG08_land_8_20_14_0_20_36_22]
MAVHYRTQGFILKKEDLREADQVFVVYTKDFGKLKILGKAIRKIKSKLRAGIDLFYLSEIEFIQGKNHKTLTEAIVIEKFKNIRNSLKKIEIASQIAEAADNLITGQEQDEKVWNLLSEVFEKLNNWKLEIIYYYFVWNLLSILGYQIDLYHCVKCQEKLIPGLMNFSSESNGIICLRCSDDSTKDKILISPETIKIFRLFPDKNWRILSRLKIEQEQGKELEEVSQSYINGIISK